MCLSMVLQAQQVVVDGTVVDAETDDPIEFASVLLMESNLWAITNEKGTFQLKNVPTGKHTLVVQCLGYRKYVIPLVLKRDVPELRIKLHAENLKLDEVTVVAKRKTDEATTSYTIDRQTLDNQQILNISDLQSLLPGGKTVNATLMSDARIALRSGSQEKGNASFGTAIEIDGMRLDNNAAMGETMGASTRTVSSANIESVEIVTGIPSVEYGDLSNGIVKVNTRKGKSPFIIEGKINQHTRQIAVNKGFELGKNGGVLNASLEHARSFSNAVSPYTAYQRNVLSLHYMNIFLRESTPLTLNLGVTGNLGGYDSEADPDNSLEDYSKARDNTLRANMDISWLLNKSWITNVKLTGSFSYSDKKSEDYSNTNSATTLPYIHTTEEG
ncbi:MAG: carboxypeptidase-like regulatory domain-containing protein, partial [Prevotella sp.]|nr:carboxypeptidase-like regulatory domain-containing protein [Prevotella sp.]